MTPSIPPHLHDLGARLSIAEVAALFEVAETTVKRHYHRYGGIKPGRIPLFFEKLVSEAVRSYYATQTPTQRQVDRAMAGPGEVPGATPPQIVRHQEGRASLGGRDATSDTRRGGRHAGSGTDRHGLLT